MKKYLVFAYIIGMLAATLLAQAGGMWQEVAHAGGAAGGLQAAVQGSR